MLAYCRFIYIRIKFIKFATANGTSDAIKRATVLVPIITLIKHVKYTNARSYYIFCYTYNYHTFLYMVIGKALMRLPVIHLV